MKPLKLVGAFSLAGAAALMVSQTRAAEPVHPIFDLKTGYFLGGTSGGKWRNAPEVSKSLGSRTTYRVYRFDRRLADAIGDKPVSQGAPCEDTLFVNARRSTARTSLPSFKESEDAFGIAGNWNALPRVPRRMSTTQPVYRNAVAAILKKHGIARPVVNIKQVWRVDLDGDREPEVLISASRYAGTGDNIQPNSRAGDYSLVLLRKLVRGQLKTVVLSEEYHPVAKTFNAPIFNKLAAVLDANGDGKMEIFLRGGYYEGGWVSVYSSSGEKATEVLSAACGA